MYRIPIDTNFVQNFPSVFLLSLFSSGAQLSWPVGIQLYWRMGARVSWLLLLLSCRSRSWVLALLLLLASSSFGHLGRVHILNVSFTGPCIFDADYGRNLVTLLPFIYTQDKVTDFLYFLRRVPTFWVSLRN